MVRGMLSVLGGTLLPALCVVGIGYNTLVAVNSSEGVRMKSLLDEQIAVERERLKALEGQHAFLSNRADRLLSASLDEDLLEERVRSVLGLVDRGEYLMRLEDLDRLALAPGERPVQEDVPAARYATIAEAAR